jgi:hypothetical protein
VRAFLLVREVLPLTVGHARMLRAANGSRDDRRD